MDAISFFAPDPDERELDPYMMALGRFIHWYSRLEATMQITLTNVTQTLPVMREVLFSGTRIREAINLMRRFERQSKIPLPELLSEALAKAQEITTARDRILHHGLDFREEGPIVSTERSAITGEAIVERVSIWTLHDLGADVLTVWARLVVFNRAVRPSEEYVDVKGWIEASQRPWRYKPDVESPPKPRRQSKRKKAASNRSRK